MTNQAQVYSKYHVGTTSHGTTTDVANRMQIMADLYEERIHLENDSNSRYNKWILLLLIGVPGGMIVLFDFSLEVGLAMIALPFIGLFVEWMKKHKQVSAFEDRTSKKLDDDRFPRFYWHEWYGEVYLREYARNRDAFEWVRDTIGECEVYQLENPLLPNFKLPKGMELYTYRLFKKGNETFQIALNESGKVGESYMILHITDQPIELTGLQIEQTVGL